MTLRVVIFQKDIFGLSSISYWVQIYPYNTGSLGRKRFRNACMGHFLHL